MSTTNFATQPTLSTPPEGWTSDKWATPWETLNELSDLFGPFDLDPCCEPHTAKAQRFYTVDDDGLRSRWFGRVFVNPPYSKPRPWCERSVEAVGNGEADAVVLLLPCATDTRWFHDVIWPNAHLHFIRGRVRFIGWQGTPIPAPRAPSLAAVITRESLSPDVAPSASATTGPAPVEAPDPLADHGEARSGAGNEEGCHG